MRNIFSFLYGCALSRLHSLPLILYGCALSRLHSLPLIEPAN
jgi:hypothetical protein